MAQTQNSASSIVVEEEHVKGAIIGFIGGIAMTVAFFVGFLSGRK